MDSPARVPCSVDTYELTHVCKGKEGSELEAAAEGWAAAAVKLLGAEKFDVISGTGRPPREVLGDMLQGVQAVAKPESSTPPAFPPRD